MPIEITNARAKCQDCGHIVATGDLQIRVEGGVYPTTLLRGSLLDKCNLHHDNNRRWSPNNEKIPPYHQGFTIIKGRQVIGTLIASSIAVEVGIRLSDPKIAQQLEKKQSEAFRNRFRTPGFSSQP